MGWECLDIAGLQDVLVVNLHRLFRAEDSLPDEGSQDATDHRTKPKHPTKETEQKSRPRKNMEMGGGRGS